MSKINVENQYPNNIIDYIESAFSGMFIASQIAIAISMRLLRIGMNKHQQ